MASAPWRTSGAIAATSCDVRAICSNRRRSFAEEIAHAVRAQDVVLDGEICCLEADGTPRFKTLLFAATGRTSAPSTLPSQQ